MNWQEYLSNAGHRITVPRKMVYEILSGAELPLSPLQINEAAKKRECDMGMVSIYRALELFLEHRLVRKIHLSEGCSGYTLATPGHTHAVVCRCCHRVVEFTGEDDLTELISDVESKTGYKIDQHLLQLEGLCKECRRGQENSKDSV